MKIRKYIPGLLVSTLLCSSLLTGCKQDTVSTEPEPVPIETSEAISTEIIIETAVAEESITEETTTESIIEEASISEEDSSKESSDQNNMIILTITIENQCGADIGMFSVIDPVTKEQVNVDSIINGESLSLEANWPISVTNFQWAVYNKNGELYTEATTDISQAKETVTISLQGEGSIDVINTTFK